MSNKDYYARWTKIKEQINSLLKEDERLQELASAFVGIKPQSTAVEIVSRVYCAYCELYNKLCDCYDQMEQVQRRPYIKQIIDAVTCRLIELKSTLEEVEVFEYTYPDNALQQMLMVPEDTQILCPFHYPFELREQEMQHILDQFASGNRVGDPDPKSTTEITIDEEQPDETGSETKIKRKPVDLDSISVESKQLSPEELETLRLQEEYNGHVINIQRMERSRYAIREKNRKFNKDTDLYLELSGLKAPQARESLRIKAATYIQNLYRRFMQIKREQLREQELKLKLGMIMPSWSPPSLKLQLEKVKEIRRNFRRKYYEQWLQENMKENSRVLRLRENDVMEDISSEIRQWFREWYDEVRQFDEFPWADEGGSILIVRGETFTIQEYLEWRTKEEKRLAAEASNPKTKEQIKQEKKEARAEKKRLNLEAKIREQKRLLDYQKQRLNPANDPGVYITVGNNIQPVQNAWQIYQSQWKDIEKPYNSENVLKGYIKQLITESAYQEMQFSLRPIVDEMMRLELQMLRTSLKNDYNAANVPRLPLTMKRKKPRKIKPPKADKVSPANMFQALADQGIIRKYPHTTLDDYWGDRNYAAADTRAILWTPTFPPPCIGDVKEQIRIRCLLTLGSNCPDAVRTQLIVGPKGSGKQTLVYAIATETNSVLIDLSPFNVYNKFPGPKNTKTMINYVNRVSKLMQPSIILINNADKLFYKKVPKEEKMFDPTRLQRNIFKEIIKQINVQDKILVIGTASEPWLAKNAQMYKVFPSLILIPRSDYGTLFYILTKTLMKYHAVNRDFNVHSVAQALRGYDINTIRKAIDSVLNPKRIAELYYKPLESMEIVSAVLGSEGVVCTDVYDYEMYKQWYMSYSPWGKKYVTYMSMLNSQLQYKLKADKKKKG